MPLSPGDNFGPYRLIAAIGRGGMGEVWKARDTRLDRIVALKVSAEQFSERFEREAKAIAALNHPHICTLHDVGPNYLVMELVEGVPLSGPLPLAKAIEYAGEILEALEHAHRKGITHRDLKPANILATKQGIKLLDFGLAKWKPAPLKETDDTLTRALTKPLTQGGQILGTLQYMSPEQLQGQEADSRSDLFSFGCVLYEMLTGKRAFDGQNAASVIAAIMERPAPSISDVAPATLDRVLKRCLEKEPDKRWQNALDLKAALEWATASETVGPTAVPAPPQSRLGTAGWIVAGIAMVTAAAMGIGYYRATRPAPLKPLVRLDVDLGAGVSLGSPQGESVTLSPDGGRIVFASKGKLYTRLLEEPLARELTGTEGGFGQFFSPDGRWIGFFTGTKLKKIAADGGSPTDLCDANSGRGASWGEGGYVAATLTSGGVVMQIPETGGSAVALTRFDEGETSHRWPQMLPGGKALLYTAYIGQNNLDQASIVAMTLADHKKKILQRGAAFGRYVATYGQTGHLLFVNKGSLYAVPFDPRILESQGTPVRILDGVAQQGGGIAEFSAAVKLTGTDTLLYRSGGASAVKRTIQWLDASGRAQPIGTKPDSYSYPSLAPGDDQVAFSMADTWAYDMRRDTMTRLSFDNGQNPVWTPDGKYVVFRKPGEGLLWTRADGGGKPQPLVRDTNQLGLSAFSPDGKKLLYQQITPVSFDLWVVPVETNASGLVAGKPQPYLRTQFNERNAAFSSDGRWIAYMSDESGRFQIYVRAFPDNGSKWQVSNEGGAYPRFTRTGHELFYRSEDSSKIFAVNYTVKGDSFLADKPRVWLEKQLYDSGLNAVNYDVAADGKRIIAMMPVDSPEAQQAQSHVIFLENFFDELRRKVPTGE